MATIELSSGTLDLDDTGGDGPVVVLLHGLLMDASLWAAVVPELSGLRVVVPTLPLGAHRHPVREGTDLSLPGLAGLVRELLERLDLHDVTLVGNDTGGALVQLVMADGEPRLAGAVLASCDAFDNLPPGLTGRFVVLTGQLPPALFGLAMQQLRLRAVRRTPLAFGRLTKRGDAVTRGWLEPLLHDRGVRRDAVRVLRAIGADRDLLVRAAERLPAFTRPVLVVWARQDRVMPREHGRRLAALLPQARFVEVDDSATLLPLDQPAVLARAVREFVLETVAAGSTGPA